MQLARFNPGFVQKTIGSKAFNEYFVIINSCTYVFRNMLLPGVLFDAFSTTICCGDWSKSIKDSHKHEFGSLRSAKAASKGF